MGLKKAFLLIALLSFAAVLLGQQTISGKITDKTEQALYGTTIILLEPQDSTMVSFGLSDENGMYRLDNVPSGSYVIQLSYVGFESQMIPLFVNEVDLELKPIRMVEATKILQEVTIQAEHIPLGIIGDTINYNTAAFRTREGASVEDLLKKLPGIEVSRSGQIKAQGEVVEQVLVDGKEFFGSDPLIATKNLEAEAIDKVQVFDKQSDIAEFTGIDDGQEEKTINLKLKEDYKQGGFGKVEAQKGSAKTMLGKANYNRFSPQMQASIIASTNNINQRSFNSNEYISFMGGLGNAISSGGLTGPNSFLGQSDVAEGIYDRQAIGANLNYDFSQKLKFSGHYFYNDLKTDLTKMTKGENFNLNQNFTNHDMLMMRSSRDNQRLNTKLIYKINPFNEVVIKATGQYVFLRENQQSETEYRSNSVLLSQSEFDQHAVRTQYAFDSSVQYKKRLNANGRNWINQIKIKSGLEREDIILKNRLVSNSFMSELFQNQIFDTDHSEIMLTSHYTEPLSQKKYLGVSYAFLQSQEQPARDFIDVTDIGLQRNTELSTSYENRLSYHRIAASLRKNTKKTKASFSIATQLTSLSGMLAQTLQSTYRSYQNLLPSANINHKISRSKKIELSYRTQINAPTLSQLMPIENNINPNLLYVGNVNLNPEYSHQLSFSYHAFDQFNSSNTSVYVNLQKTGNRIINKTTFNDILSRIITPINVDHYQYAKAIASYTSPLRPLKINVRVNLDLQALQYENFIDDVKNNVGENKANLSLRIDNRHKDLIDISAGFKMNFTKRVYSLNQEFNQDFVNYDWFIEGNIFIGPKTTLTTSFDHKSYSGEFFSESRSFNIWNVEFSQRFLQSRINVKLIARDLLNQNQGLTRFGSENSLSQSNFNTLSRYFMAGLSYKLGKTRNKDTLSIQFDE